MTNKKKIALLNMPYDNNYGGNMQRYALVKTLERMGYEVDYLYMRCYWDDWSSLKSSLNCLKKYGAQIRKHFKNSQEPLCAYAHESSWYVENTAVTEPFLNKYIHHTTPIFSSIALKRVFEKGHYDAIVAGSDQIWRKKFVERLGLGMWFLNFVPNYYPGIRLIYGASFGVEEREYTAKDIATIKPFFEKLDAVSVREDSALTLLQTYGLTKPNAQQVLDPTLLLDREDYLNILVNGNTNPLEGNMFCYILDRSPEKLLKIEEIAKERGLKPVVFSIYEDKGISIEQWLRNYSEASYIFTDSYHGLLFSLIFQKPFYLVNNSFRGNARFDSVSRTLKISLNEEPEWSELSKRIEELRKLSLNFIKKSLQ